MTSSFNTSKHQIDRALAEFLDNQISHAQDPAQRDLLQAIRSLICRGGKRLRPLLTLEAHEGFDGNSDGMMNVALAQEFIHMFLLIHDDLIDKDLRRYSGLNINGYYLQRFSKTQTPPEASHMAKSWALLAGDICFDLAIELIDSSKFDANQIKGLIQLARRSVMTTITGQLSELAMTLRGGQSAAAEQIVKMYANKTATYSFALPMQTGAILAGANETDLKAIEAFSLPLGIAYQISDDLEEFNKSKRWSDFRNAKPTLLAHLGFEKANPQDRKFLLRSYGNHNLSVEELAKVKQIFLKHNVPQSAQATCDFYLDQAVALLDECKFNAAAKQNLMILVNNISESRRY